MMKQQTVNSATQIVAIFREKKQTLKKTNYTIAKESGLQRSTLKRIFDGVTIPNFDTIIKIGKVLNININIDV